MITYAERACFREQHLRLFSRIEAYVACVSNTWGNELRCHELVRAIHGIVDARPLTLEIIDGKCGPIEHSWLRSADGVIYDPYAPGRLPAVQIIDPIVSTAYRPGFLRTDIRQAIVVRLVLEMRGCAVA